MKPNNRILLAGIPVELQRKNIKNLHLYVLPPDGRVRLSVPMRFPKERAEEFVASKRDWICRQQEKIAQRTPLPAPEYRTGEEIFLFGERLLLTVESVPGKPSVQRSGDTVRLTYQRGAEDDPDTAAAKREAILNEWYRGLLRGRIAGLLPVLEEITGLHADSWQIRNMKTRWGTCNPRTRKIWLNLQLAKQPPAFLEYVLLHELAHLQIPGHGRDFEALLDRFMPDWRERKQLSVNV